MDTSPSFYDELKSWIESSPGGFIHPSLTLFERKNNTNNNTEQKFPHRGIKCTTSIPSQTLLIRLPISLALSGKTNELKNQISNDENVDSSNATKPSPSPWLRCIGQLLLEKKKYDHSPTESKFSPYLQSLPSSFDTLQSWSTRELETFLRGTALGEMALIDRKEHLTRTRFEQSVVPYLKSLVETNGIGKDGDGEEMSITYDDFLWATQCLSTRGFSMEGLPSSSSSSTLEAASTYTGPYLLPYIDLLNHDTMKKCTTLQRCFYAGKEGDSSNDNDTPFFCMIAERDIMSEEEIFHSYFTIQDGSSSDSPKTFSSSNNTIPGAQILQTFGFVTRQHMELAALSLDDKKADLENHNNTVAVLNRKDIIESCHNVAFSSWVQKFREENNDTMLEEEEEEDDDLYWDPTDVWETKSNHLQMKQSFLSEQILASKIDEVATCCVMLLLPNDAFRDLFVQDDNPGVLDTSQIFSSTNSSYNTDDMENEEDDPWLGTLVGMAILDLIDRQARKYCVQAEGGLVNILKKNVKDLGLMLEKNEQTTQSERQIAGLTIQIEEQKSLERLRRNALKWISFNVSE